MKINSKHTLFGFIVIVMLQLTSCSNADNMLTIDGRQYAINIGDIEDLAISTGIKITGDDIVQKFNEHTNKQAPAWMSISINGNIVEATGHISTKEYVMFVFDGLETVPVIPDEIIVYNTADAAFSLKFDGKTKSIKK